MAREDINGISVPIPGTGEPADFVGDLRRIASDLPTSYALTRLAPAAVSRGYGHSFMYGSTTSSNPAVRFVSDMATLIANTLGLPNDNRGVSGATLSDAASSGDWADILQTETRNQTFEPVGGAFAVMYGLNDAAQIGHTYSELASFKSALVAIVSRMRAAAVFEDSHSSVAYGGSGTWSVYSGSNKNSGSTCRYNNTAGGTVTITPPSDFPGGTLTVTFPVWGDGSSCTWQTVVNGTTYTLDTSTVARTGNHPTVAALRIPDVKANNGPITLTVTAVSASGSARSTFDCWSWEPPERSCGVVALISQPKPLDYTSQSGAPAGPVTDAGVDVINQIISEVVDLFGERVVYVDTSAIDSNAAYWEAGNVHPNADGHAYIAAQTAAAIKAVATILPSSKKTVTALSSSGSVAYTPTLDGSGTSLGAGTAAGTYRDFPNGDREFQALITVAADTVIGSTTYVGLPSAEVSGTLEVGSLKAEIFRSSGTNPGYYPIRAHLGASSGKAILRQTTLDANGRMQSITSSAPLALTTGDVIRVTGLYRAA